MVSTTLCRTGDVCAVRKGTTITEKEATFGEVPVVAGGMKPSYFHDESNRLPGVVTISASGANAGFVSYWDCPIWASDCTTVEPINPTSVSSRYVFHYLKSIEATVISSFRRGAAQPHVYARDLQEIMIPLPPIEEQRRIASILDAADALCTKRRQALVKLDTLTQAIFIDMFGDPVSNSNGWPKLPLSELGRVVTGKTPPSAKSGMFSDEVPFVTPGDLESGDPSVRWLSKEGASHSRVVPAGSTLVCCIGATIGKVGQAITECAFNQQINAVDWDRSVILPAYGTKVMKSFRQEIARLGASTTLPLLKKTSFEKVEIPVPPMKFQVEFQFLSEALAQCWTRLTVQSAVFEKLFATLQHRAFRGEL